MVKTSGRLLKRCTHSGPNTSIQSPCITRSQFHQNFQMKQVPLELGAVSNTFLKSARDAECHAININSLGQTVPEKSAKMSMFCIHLAHNHVGSQRMPYPFLVQVQPIVTCNTSPKPALAVLHSGENIRKLAQTVHTQWTKHFHSVLLHYSKSVSPELSNETSPPRSWCSE